MESQITILSEILLRQNIKYHLYFPHAKCSRQSFKGSDKNGVHYGGSEYALSYVKIVSNESDVTSRTSLVVVTIVYNKSTQSGVYYQKCQ